VIKAIINVIDWIHFIRNTLKGSLCCKNFSSRFIVVIILLYGMKLIIIRRASSLPQIQLGLIHFLDQLLLVKGSIKWLLLRRVFPVIYDNVLILDYANSPHRLLLFVIEIIDSMIRVKWLLPYGLGFPPYYIYSVLAMLVLILCHQSMLLIVIVFSRGCVEIRSDAIVAR
jgi:hypothetical protein